MKVKIVLIDGEVVEYDDPHEVRIEPSVIVSIRHGQLIIKEDDSDYKW